MVDAPTTLDTPPDDPVFLHARREMWIIFAIWAIAFAWVVPYCYLNGYTSVGNPDELRTVFGIPHWVFYGVALPWLIADVVTVALCVWVIQDDDLNPAPT